MNNFNLSPIFCANNGVLLLEQSNNSVLFGIVKENNDLRLLLIKRYLQFLKNYNECSVDSSNIQFKIISKEFFIRETSKKFALDYSKNNTENNNSTNTEKLHVIEDAPIINLLNSMILECYEKNGSDIHIESFEKYSKIRMRVLNDLEEYNTIDKKTANALLLRILFLANLDITENRNIQDGSFTFKTESVHLDIRVSVLPSHYGASIVLRLLNCKKLVLNYNSLGFNTTAITFLETITRMKNSLFLVSGTTGSGKSTTLAAILQQLVSSKKKIVTIEDPVEYRIEGVTQISTNQKLHLDFSDILRGAFRHDPDVIMIGEIRDITTASIAVRAALTGHLVLASIHSSDAPSAILRLLDMGIESWLLASVFGGVIYQNLVQKSKNNTKFLIPKTEILPGTFEVKSLIKGSASLYEYNTLLDEKKPEVKYELCELYR